MNVAYNFADSASIQPPDTGSRTPLSVVRFVILPLSLALWAIGVAHTNTSSLGQYGLLTALPLIFYVGLVLLLVSVGIELSRARLSSFLIGLHAVSLVLMLYGTPALVYQAGRYGWLYKTVGIVQYVNQHGSLDRSIDIYQDWPGFFALAGWFNKVAGVNSALQYAKWAQVVFELAAIPLLYAIYKSLSLPVWHRWLAIMLYSGSNWISQDYFSPQGVTTVISLGLMAILVRWMLVFDVDRRGSQAYMRGDQGADANSQEAVKRQIRRALPFVGILILLFFVITMTHELSPYIIIIQVAMLVVIRSARPAWVAPLLAIIAVGYLLPNISFVNSHYGLFSSIGNFFGNVQTPSAKHALPTPESRKVVADCADLLSLGIWALALVGAWRRRKARRMVLTLLVLTFSPILVLFGGGYGNEGILRVFLFSLPWAVVLAVCALAPLRGKRGDAGHSAMLAVIPLGLAVTLFFPAFFGNDLINAMPASEVRTITAFLETAKPGPILGATDNWSGSDANYNDFPFGWIYGSPGSITLDKGDADIATYIARSFVHYSGYAPAYVIIAPSMVNYNTAYAVTPPGNIIALRESLGKSAYWKLVTNSDGTIIYQLTSAAKKIPSGPFSQKLSVVVP
jgi:hypothetical protein